MKGYFSNYRPSNNQSRKHSIILKLESLTQSVQNFSVQDEFELEEPTAVQTMKKQPTVHKGEEEKYNRST